MELDIHQIPQSNNSRIRVREDGLLYTTRYPFCPLPRQSDAASSKVFKIFYHRPPSQSFNDWQREKERQTKPPILTRIGTLLGWQNSCGKLKGGTEWCHTRRCNKKGRICLRIPHAPLLRVKYCNWDENICDISNGRAAHKSSSRWETLVKALIRDALQGVLLI